MATTSKNGKKASSNGNGDSACENKKTRCKTMIIDGDKYRTTLTSKYENRKQWEYPNEKLLESYIPGTILELNIKDGASIKKGDQILVFEAMKMKNTVFSPMSGKIKKVNIKEGDRIPKGFVMVEYE